VRFRKRGDFLMKKIREMLDRIPTVAGSCIDNDDAPGAMMLLDVSDWLEGLYQDLMEPPTRAALPESVRGSLWLADALSVLKVIRDMAAGMSTDKGPLCRMLLLDRLMDDMSQYQGTLRDRLIAAKTAGLAA
jgi:hypothetical protein